MWIHHKFFQYGAGILLVLLIIFMLGQVPFFLLLFQKIAGTLFIPVLTAGLLYYILRPLVRLIEKLRLPRVAAILITFFLVVGLFVLFSTYTGAVVADQFRDLTNDLPAIFQAAKQRTTDFMHNEWLNAVPFENLQEKFTAFLENATRSLSNFILNMLSALASFGTVLFVAPFILFYFLKDDLLFLSRAEKHIPAGFKENVHKILHDIDGALSSYILGQMLVALAVGILMFIGYLIIGLKYSLILALFAMLTSIIPFFGPWIGIVPAMLIGLTDNPFMLVKVILVMLIVQQLDGNFISPQIMGKRLAIHPVTVILLLMIGVTLFGFVGLIIIIPAYAALKVTVKNLYKMYYHKPKETA